MNKRLQKLIAEQGIGVGNYWSDVQFSNYIRPQGETACNGFTFPPGQLRTFDLKPYQRYPFAIRLARRYPDQKTILYVWRSANTTYGASITNDQNVVLDRVILTGPNFVSTVLELEAKAGFVYSTARNAA